MSQLQDALHEYALGRLSLRLPGLLHQAGVEHQAQQGGSGRDAGSHCPIPTEPWPGAHLGVRAPGIDETPLSIDECWIAVREGLT